MKTEIIKNIEINSIYDIDSLLINQYFKFKNKNGLSFSGEENELFINQTTSEIKNNVDLSYFDLILTPESSNKNLKTIINNLNLPVVYLEKRNNEELIIELDKQFFMKQEKNKLYKSIKEQNKVKIGLISANQRNRVSNVLFKEPVIDLSNKKVLFIDDSFFTGSTLFAINQKYNIEKNLVLFKQSS
jgi:phosphoribosylpyrophosphate synthetase